MKTHSPLHDRQAIGTCDICSGQGYKRKPVPRSLRDSPDDPQELLLCNRHYMRAYRAERAGALFSTWFTNRNRALTAEEVEWVRSVYDPSKARFRGEWTSTQVAHQLGVSSQTGRRLVRTDYSEAGDDD